MSLQRLAALHGLRVGSRAAGAPRRVGPRRGPPAPRMRTRRSAVAKRDRSSPAEEPAKRTRGGVSPASIYSGSTRSSAERAEAERSAVRDLILHGFVILPADVELGGVGELVRENSATTEVVHHEEVRRVRRALAERVEPILGGVEDIRVRSGRDDYALIPRRCMQVLFEGVGVGEEGLAPVRASGFDDLFGGCLALEDQEFAYIPDTHRDDARRRAVLGGADYELSRVALPAGHFVLAHQHLLHARSGGRCVHHGYRLCGKTRDFLGYGAAMRTLGPVQLAGGDVGGGSPLRVSVRGSASPFPAYGREERALMLPHTI